MTSLPAHLTAQIDQTRAGHNTRLDAFVGAARELTDAGNDQSAICAALAVELTKFSESSPNAHQHVADILAVAILRLAYPEVKP
ncbi:MAG: hypothetical protein PGN37_20475 [Mycobacterium kyogaense]|uniref:hypothetical protein n=1 Tax=Mycobacterium kyogaense TaxID=2212479 RepID=UPI002FFA8CCB